MASLWGPYGPQVKSITVDHGKEFANYQALEQDYQIKVIFAIHIHHGSEVPMNILIDGYAGSSRKRPILAK
ncbi:Mobile element protein [Levilactobacillus brevis]|nr:Mobile element protein [Levilactobacillus brevis]